MTAKDIAERNGIETESCEETVRSFKHFIEPAMKEYLDPLQPAHPDNKGYRIIDKNKNVIGWKNEQPKRTI